MAGHHGWVFSVINLGSALLLLAPALAAAQEPAPVPPPPKQETIVIRAVSGEFELKGTSSPDLFEFTERCESSLGYARSTVQLTLPMELEGGPNNALEGATALLRDAVAKGRLVVVEPSSEAGQVAMFYWFGLPRFQGVITSVGVKYAIFSPDGIPLRATANVTFNEASRAESKGQGSDTDKPAEKKQPGCRH